MAAQDLWQDNFGAEAPFALGVEEELLLVGDDNELIDKASRLLREAEPDAGDVDGELFKAMVEARSEVSANAGEAVDALREVRRELLDSGGRLIGAGVHPNAAPGEAGVYQTPRYALIEDSLQGVLRTPICGQHIHVGMPDQETAVRAYNGIRTHIEADRDQSDIPAREALAESSFQATRHGLDAKLLDRRGEPVPARELARESLKTASGAAEEFGCERELEYIAIMLEEGSGADLQRTVHAAAGMEGLVEFLVAETARLDRAM